MDVSNNSAIVNHVLISKEYRYTTQMGMKLKNDITDLHLANSLKSSLEEHHDKYIIYLAEIKKYDIKNTCYEDENFIEFEVLIVYFTIPKQIVEQLILNNMNKCKFYITDTADINNILISSVEPDKNKLALYNSDGNLSPYETVELKFEINNDV